MVIGSKTVKIYKIQGKSCVSFLDNFLDTTITGFESVKKLLLLNLIFFQINFSFLDKKNGLKTSGLQSKISL